MKNIFCILIVFLIVSCEGNVIQYPVNYDKDEFMKFSRERGKLILEEDNELIQNYIDSLGINFHKTNYGFWISNSGEITPTMAKVGDFVQYEYEVIDFDNNLIYSKSEIGVQDAVLGKVDLPRGLHSSLQMIEKGDSAFALLPSFLAYGGYGDRNKIGGDIPLIFKIKMLDIKKIQ